MKHFKVFLLGAFLLTVFVNPAFSQLRKDRDYYVGRIIDVDHEARKITLKDKYGRELSFVVEKGWEVAQLDNYVFVNAEKGTNIAKGLRKVQPK